MQTITEHLTDDFEVHPIGTGRAIAQMADQNRTLREALAGMLDTALACDDLSWADAVTRAGTNRPCDAAAYVLDRL